MTKIDKYINTNKKPVEIVHELKDEYKIPSYEEFMKDYQANEKVNYADLNNGDMGVQKGYGPCLNSWCGCDCSSNICNCPSAEVSIYKKGSFSIGNYSASGKARIGKEYPEEAYVIANGQASRSLFRIKDHTGDLRILSDSIGGEIGPSKDGYAAKVRVGADLIGVKSNGVELRAGLNVDSGFSTREGLEVKGVGFGFSVGKKIGLSTPVGEVKVDTDECVIQ